MTIEFVQVTGHVSSSRYKILVIPKIGGEVGYLFQKSETFFTFETVFRFLKYIIFCETCFNFLK